MPPYDWSWSWCQNYDCKKSIVTKHGVKNQKIERWRLVTKVRVDKHHSVGRCFGRYLGRFWKKTPQEGDDSALKTFCFYIIPVKLHRKLDRWQTQTAEPHQKRFLSWPWSGSYISDIRKSNISPTNERFWIRDLVMVSVTINMQLDNHRFIPLAQNTDQVKRERESVDKNSIFSGGKIKTRLKSDRILRYWYHLKTRFKERGPIFGT